MKLDTHVLMFVISLAIASPALAQPAQNYVLARCTIQAADVLGRPAPGIRVTLQHAFWNTSQDNGKSAHNVNMDSCSAM